MECDGSIGREPDNAWVLPDPERYISARHALITYQENSYYLTDTSTNGVFVNGSTTAIGNGNTAILHNGDSLTLGDYEIDVCLDEHASIEPTLPPDTFLPLADDLIDKSATNPGSDPGVSESLDPLAMTLPPAATPEMGAESDHVSSLAESFQAPDVSREAIPDDWDMTDYSTLEALQNPEPLQGEGPVVPKPPSPPTAPQAPISTSQNKTEHVALPVAGGSELSAAFLRGLGIDVADPGSLESIKSMENYGILLREVVQGIMEVLKSRAALKSEFRMSLTTIRPVENNPLKFSPSVDEALKILFSSQSAGYLSPVESIHEGFEDIKCHQMAMVAGMQAAYRSMLEQFDPEKFQEQSKGGMRVSLPMSRNARNWDKYCEYFEKITGDTEQSYQALFGEAFSRAYEDQIQRLIALRNK